MAILTACHDCGYPATAHGRTEREGDRLRRFPPERVQVQTWPAPPVCPEYRRTYPVMGVL